MTSNLFLISFRKKPMRPKFHLISCLCVLRYQYNIGIEESYMTNNNDHSILLIDFSTSFNGTDWINSNNDRYTSNGSMIKEKQHEAFLQALVSDQNSEMQYLLENHFGLQDTFKRTINESSQWKFRKLYSTPKPVVKMKFNKLLAARMITSIHARRGRAVKLKPIRCQVVVNKFNSCICRQCIHDYSTRYRDFHNKESLREVWGSSAKLDDLADFVNHIIQ